MFTAVLSNPAQATLAVLGKFNRSKKDFIELFQFTQNNLSLDTLCSLYEKQYPLRNANTFNLIKSITYFENAEETAMPDMLIPISWNEVKFFFLSESKRLVEKYLNAS